MLKFYLQDLERELAARLPENDVHVRLAEAESHLRSEVATLTALGLDSLSAEREAVASFGKTTEVARAAERSRLRLRESVRTLLLVATVALALLWILRVAPEWPMKLAALALAPAAVWARRPASRKAFLSGGVAVLTALALYPALYVTLPGEAIVLRREAAGQAKGLERLAADLDVARDRFDHVETDWKAIRQPNGYLAPTFVGKRLEFRVMWSRDDAEKAWDFVAAHHDRLETGYQKNRAVSIRDALSHPLRNVLASAAPILAGGTAVTLGLLFVEGLFGAIGAFAFALRRCPRSQPRLADPEGDPRLKQVLSDLERELTRGLPQNEVSDRAAEARAHLQEVMEARQEMGIEPDDAARDAVLAFGPVSRVAREMIRQGLATLSSARRSVVFKLYAAYSLLAFFITLPGAKEPGNVVLLLGRLAGLGALAIAAFRSRCPALATPLASSVGAVVALWVFGAATTLHIRQPDGSYALLPRWDVADGIQNLETSIGNRRATRQRFGRDWKAYRTRGIEAFSDSFYAHGGVYRFPFVGTDGTLIYSGTNREWAIEGWNDSRKNVEAKTDTSDLERQLAVVRFPLDHPLSNLAANVPAVFVNNVQFVLVVVVTDVAFAELGSLVLALRRRNCVHV